MKIKHLAAFIAASLFTSAQAQTSINLGNYSVANTYALSLNAGAVSGLEGSAITYARDRFDTLGNPGTLFWVGDEGTGVIEISRTGQTIGSMALNWAGTGATNNDAEGLTYVGGGNLVVAEERLYDAFRFGYSAGGTTNLANSFVSISNAAVGNSGLEGISYDPRNGSFVSVKQQSPQDILAGTLTFAGGAGGVSTMSNLFNPALLGLGSLSDIQTLSPVDALAGTPAADNLLVLSLASRRLLEVTRSGVIMSQFDLSGVLPRNAIEGVTVDQNGNIYLVAEQDQNSGAPIGAQSQLIVLSVAAVPEPANWALMLAGIGFLGAVAKRPKKGV